MDFGDEFKGKKVVVTGACGVIGSWISRGFVDQGADVCLTDRDTAGLDKLANALGLGGTSFVHTADLTDAKSIQDLVSAVGEKWGAPDILINNAGIYPSGFLLDIDEKDWDLIFGINVRAPFILSRSMSLLMIGQKHGGNIINISSGASRKMRSSVVPYCVSKAALDRLTKGFALELAEHGIRVNAIEPGFVPGSKVSPLPAEHIEKTIDGIPLGRPTSADDVVPAILYLCSAAASYLTGMAIAVDGGNSIGSMQVYQNKKRSL